jgi:hypothetical protein
LAFRGDFITKRLYPEYGESILQYTARVGRGEKNFLKVAYQIEILFYLIISFTPVFVNTKKTIGSFFISVKSYAKRGGQSRESLPATR